MNLGGIIGRLVYALLVAVITYVILLIVASVLGLLPALAAVGDILRRFASVLALLAGLVAFFTGTNPWHRTV